MWANDLALERLWVYDRASDGTLTPAADLALPGVIDNVEYDAESGDLSMGLIFRFQPGEERDGGALVARKAAEYRPVIVIEQKDFAISRYQVSSAIEYGGWVVLGSPGAVGLAICHDTAWTATG